MPSPKRPTVALISSQRMSRTGAGAARLEAFSALYEAHGWAIERLFEYSSREASVGRSTRIPDLVVRQIQRLGFLGDLSPSELIVAYRCIQRSRADLFIVSVPPFSLIALLAVLKGPTVLDYRDHYSFSPRVNPLAVLCRRLERRLAYRADWIITAGLDSSVTLIKSYVHPHPPVTLVRNGVLADETAHARTDSRPGPLQLAFAGHLYGRTYAAPILDAIAMVSEGSVHLTMVGDTRYAPSLLESSAVSARPATHKRGLAEILADSDVGLVLENQDYPYETSVPAKVYDYMAAGLPILFIGLERPGFAQDAPYVVVAPPEPEALARLFTSLDWRSRRYPPKLVDRIAESAKLIAISNALLDRET